MSLTDLLWPILFLLEPVFGYGCYSLACMFGVMGFLYTCLEPFIFLFFFFYISHYAHNQMEEFERQEGLADGGPWDQGYNMFFHSQFYDF
ncbi:hypothetical protein CAEBREN_08732 [Caenorhabditis brenneri]|uniref:Uncharacterized protein n=1 Tax=Caenorhabditis brenneri TaxID=135651 RepID=G0NSM0_CAEBE|nr:hypothetical protein CAEBREN_08732 [Caenorhabditis brenneri]